MRRLLIALLLAPLSASAEPKMPTFTLSESIPTAYQTEAQGARLLEARLWKQAFTLCELPLRDGEITRSKPAAFALELSARFSCGRLAPPLAARAAGAELIVAGKVMTISPPELERPLSEHSPHWQRATVAVSRVAKGDPSLRTVEIRFPGSTDVAWYGRPRFTVGQQATWLLRRDESGAWTALDPQDVAPASAVEIFAAAN
jgi:hypothetical protein